MDGDVKRRHRLVFKQFKGYKVDWGTQQKLSKNEKEISNTTHIFSLELEQLYTKDSKEIYRTHYENGIGNMGLDTCHGSSVCNNGRFCENGERRIRI